LFGDLSRQARQITGGMTVWRNWARNQSCAPAALARPTGEDELVAVVRDAVAAGRRLKAVGAGHSFTGAACTDGVLVDLRRHRRLLAHDRAAGTVTVEAGITLRALCEELDRLGLALPNMGDIAYQSIAGATATATHGTGVAFGNLSTQLAGMRLVTADATVLECSATENADIFDVARVSLGALGIVSSMTLQCCAAFNLHAVEEPMPVDDVLADFDGFMASTDHVEFYWVPGTRWALTKRNTRSPEPLRPRSRRRRLYEDYWASNAVFGLACRLGRRWPHAIPRLMKLVPSTGRADYVDRSDRVFTSPRLVRFYEMEYAIPAEAVPDALNRVRRLVADLGTPISFPVEVRLVAGDDIALSTAYGRRTGYIAVHVYRGTSGYERYFRGVEAIMDDYGGRPHWGKLHYQRAETLAPRYPRWDDFAAVRRRLDPHGAFSNPYLDRVLGTQTSGHG
jgi:L-gulonolactone oxidase